MESFIYLGVPINVTLDELNKVYREKAKKYHPDRQDGDCSTFQSLHLAYTSVKSVIENPMHAIMLKRIVPGGEKGGDIIVETSLSLEDFFKGTKLNVHFKRNVISYKNSYKCKNCIGSGVIYCRNLTLNKCSHCRGDGIFNYTEKVSSYLQLDIAPFFEHRTLVFENEGDHSLKGKRGNLIINIHIKNDYMFNIINYDLHATILVKLSDALVGFTRLISHPSGDILTITCNKPVKPEENIIFKGRGLKKNDGTMGDFIVTIKLIFPDSVSDTGKRLIKMAI